MESERTRGNSTVELRAFECAVCSKEFTRSSSLIRHQKTQHGIQNETAIHRFTCPVDSCTVLGTFRTVSLLKKHCEEYHPGYLTVQDHLFTSWKEFEEWKAAEEEETNTCYIQQTEAVPVTQDKENGMKYYYTCCRDGNYRQNKTMRKTQECRPGKGKKPSRKLGSPCISRMYCTREPGGCVRVQYIQTHTNHNLSIGELKHVPLPAGTKQKVAMQLSMGVPIPRILEDNRDGIGRRESRVTFEDNVKRQHFLTVQDCRNIARKIHHKCIVRHENDAQSVALVVGELQTEENNSVLFYKPQNTEDKSGKNLPKESFLLVLQTEFQKELYTRFASKVVCIDSTHKTNSYDFKLISLLVPDDYGEGQPVAWCLSDREDTQVMEVFLGAVHMQSPEAGVCVVMTDDDNTGWAAARNIFGKDIHHILCRWHIERAWRKKILAVVKSEKERVELYQTLTLLLEEKDQKTFENRLESFMKIWKPVQPDFITYFQQHYANRTDKWALCYRNFPHGDTDTNMFVESFHNKLKCNPAYLDSKANKRIDYLLTVLLRVEEDMYFSRKYKDIMWKPNKLLTLEMERHYKAMKIEATQVNKVSSDEWTIPSVSNPTKAYNIIRKAYSCIHSECTVKCHSDDCKPLCIHLYSCDCYDAQNGHICKHIHRVHSIYKPVIVHVCDDIISDSSEIIDDDISGSPEIIEDSATEVLQQHLHPKTFTCREGDNGVCIKPEKELHQSCHYIQKAHGMLDILREEITEENKAVYPFLPHILAVLNKAVVTVKACKADVRAELSKMEEKESIAPGKKHDLQPRFHQTTKKGTKRKGQILSHANTEKKKKLQESLDNECLPEDCHFSPAVPAQTTQSLTSGKRRKACGQCFRCKAEDCGKCRFCQDKPKFGGKGKLKQKCLHRRCMLTISDESKCSDPDSVSPGSINSSSSQSTMKINDEHHSNHSQSSLLANDNVQGTSLIIPTISPSKHSSDEPSPSTSKALLHHTQLVSVSQFLVKYNRGIMPVKGDGNCFFRAISKVLFNSEDWHPHVRNLFLKYTEANADIFRRFCFSHQLEEHLKRMQYETVWATQLEVFVAASALQLPIYVCTQKTATHEYYWEVFKPQPASSLVVPSDVISVNPVALGIHHIELCHVMRCHYDLLTLSDGTMPLHPPNINPCTDFIDLTC